VKTCKKCEKVKPLSDYYKHSTGKDGHTNFCKRCCLDGMKERYDPKKRAEYVQRYYSENDHKVKARSKAWREKYPERYRQTLKNYTDEKKAKDPAAYKERARSYALKRKYGITLEQYQQLLEKQNECCAVCERPAKDFPTSLAVDHDHKTGRIRGLLCTHCNYRMVAKHTDGNVLRKIADYIEQGTDWYVPEKKKRRKKIVRKS
jgi:DNA-binding transcriptional MerR regulator